MEAIFWTHQSEEARLSSSQLEYPSFIAYLDAIFTLALVDSSVDLLVWHFLPKLVLKYGINPGLWKPHTKRDLFSLVKSLVLSLYLCTYLWVCVNNLLPYNTYAAVTYHRDVINCIQIRALACSARAN